MKVKEVALEEGRLKKIMDGTGQDAAPPQALDPTRSPPTATTQGAVHQESARLPKLNNRVYLMASLMCDEESEHMSKAQRDIERLWPEFQRWLVDDDANMEQLREMQREALARKQPGVAKKAKMAHAAARLYLAWGEQYVADMEGRIVAP